MSESALGGALGPAQPGSVAAAGGDRSIVSPPPLDRSGAKPPVESSGGVRQNRLGDA
jgi:hypothetical protein